MRSQLQSRRDEANRGDGAIRDRASDYRNREDLVASRRDNLQSRLDGRENGRDDRQDFRNDSREDRQDFREDAREDWQDWAGGRHWDDHWHHDHWHGHFDNYWHHMWDHHPVYSAFRVTVWGVNRVNYLFGWRTYYNPYPVAVYPQTTVINYNEPLVSYAPIEQYAIAPATTESAAPETVESASDVPDAAVDQFDAAREAFADGDYETALKSVDEAIAELPKDATLHEFRSLILFALKKYRESTAAIHAVLAVGPGWNWSTMSGLYEDTDDYVNQLRELEETVKSNSDAADTKFLLAYHYLTMGHNDNAIQLLQSVLKLEPRDNVAADLVTMLGGELPDSAARPEPADLPGPKATEQELLGTWKTKSDDAAFELSLEKSGEFTWTYSADGDIQKIQGVYAVDDGVLAMEPDSGGVMLAEVGRPENDSFVFQQAGDASKQLVFKRSQPL